MTKETVVEKVRKMLALAHDKGATENESQSAMLMAQRLMAKHNITVSDVDVEDDEKEVVHENVTEIQRTIWWKKSLASVIGGNFRCITYTQRYGNGKSSIVFLGLKEDVEIAKEVFAFAIDSIQHYANKYVRKISNEGYSTSGVRNDFMRGYIQGLNKQFEEQKANNQELALVLVLDKEVEKARDNMSFRKAQQSKVASARSQKAFSSGFDKGKNFDYGRKQVSC